MQGRPHFLYTLNSFCLLASLSLAFGLFSSSTSSAQSISKHHYFVRKHKGRLLTDKRYNQISDSNSWSIETTLGNVNAWNGDIYNSWPALGFIATYDDNKHLEIGAFVSVSPTPSSINTPHGNDLFIVYTFTPHLACIADVYTYIDQHNQLENNFGYSSTLYQMYSLRFQYTLLENHQLYLGWSRLNDFSHLQQSYSAEYDYLFHKHVQWVIGYASDSDPFHWQLENVYTGLAWIQNIRLGKKNTMQLNSSFYPTNMYSGSTVWPFTLQAVYQW